mgnify:CR=1 FL=1
MLQQILYAYGFRVFGQAVFSILVHGEGSAVVEDVAHAAASDAVNLRAPLSVDAGIEHHLSRKLGIIHGLLAPALRTLDFQRHG